MTVAATRTSTATKLLSHPLNAWYAAGWDHEITGRGILSRTVAGRPPALWRTEDGRAVALADACRHRLAPLSQGKLVGRDGIQCPYHGLRCNAAGRCTSMPAQEALNPSATVPSFPVLERHRCTFPSTVCIDVGVADSQREVWQHAAAVLTIDVP